MSNINNNNENNNANNEKNKDYIQLIGSAVAIDSTFGLSFPIYHSNAFRSISFWVYLVFLMHCHTHFYITKEEINKQ